METAPQDSKPMKKLKQTLGNEAEESSLSNGRGNGGKVFSSEEKGDGDRNSPGRLTGKFFKQERYMTFET